MAGEDPSARGEAFQWFFRGVGFATGALAVYALAVGLLAATRVLLLVLIALLLASALEPVIGWLRNRLQLPRGAALLVTYATFFVSLLAIGLLLVPALIDEAGTLGAALPGTLDHLSSMTEQLQPSALRNGINALIKAAQTAARPASPPTAGQVVSAGLTVADVVISVLTVLTLIYFWTTERSRLQRFGLSFLPAHHRSEVRDAWNDVEIRLGGWVRGQLVLMTIVGASTGAVYAALGLPSALALGLIAGVAEVIPLLGPALGAVPAILVAATQKPDVLIPVIVAYVAIQLVESNVLVPRIMRNAIGVSPFLILVSLLIGGAIAGIVGALVAVPCAAGIVGILERMQDRDAPVSQDATASGGPPKAESVGEPSRASRD